MLPKKGLAVRQPAVRQPAVRQPAVPQPAVREGAAGRLQEHGRVTIYDRGLKASRP